MFTRKYRDCVEYSRTLGDWNSMAIKLKSRSPVLLSVIMTAKYVETSQRMDKNLRSISKEYIGNQFKVFLKRLQNETKEKKVEDIEKTNPKDMIKLFMKNEELHNGIELVMQATAVAAVKMSVESIAESFISIYNLHNNKLRPIEESTAEAEMMIHMSGPEIGEAEDVLKSALDLHFEGKPWHFVLTQNIFKAQGKVVKDVLLRKSDLPFYK